MWKNILWIMTLGLGERLNMLFPHNIMTMNNKTIFIIQAERWLAKKKLHLISLIPEFAMSTKSIPLPYTPFSMFFLQNVTIRVRRLAMLRGWLRATSSPWAWGSGHQNPAVHQTQPKASKPPLHQSTPPSSLNLVPLQNQ